MSTVYDFKPEEKCLKSSLVDFEKGTLSEKVIAALVMSSGSKNFESYIKASDDINYDGVTHLRFCCCRK